jgi:hypothetical protein
MYMFAGWELIGKRKWLEGRKLKQRCPWEKFIIADHGRIRHGPPADGEAHARQSGSPSSQ